MGVNFLEKQGFQQGTLNKLSTRNIIWNVTKHHKELQDDKGAKLLRL